MLRSLVGHPSRASFVLGAACAGCNQPGDVLCGRCRFALSSAAVQHNAGVSAPLAFEGVARQVVLGLKYRNRRQVARQLAHLMVYRLRLGVDGPIDVVSWAPTGARHLRDRGFDQAEALARAVARELGVPCRRLLFRSHAAPAQTGRARADRLRGPAFRARSTSRPLRVLLVDDVVTTGATLQAARAALLAAGVGSVQCVAAASTPSARPVDFGPPWESSTESSVPVKARN